MSKVQVGCETCNTPFLAEVKERNRGNGRFCSRSCAASRSRPDARVHVTLTCALCDKVFQRKPSYMQNSRSGLYFCTRRCKDKAQRIGGIAAIQPPHYGDGAYRKYRKRALEELPHKCNRCPYDDVRILIVHHIDRDRTNNDISNLEILCRNCHAEEHWEENGCHVG